MSQIVLGKVAFVDKGVYATASTYNTFDFVVTDDSCYLCVKDGNKNHPLTDTAWWKCIARGTQATVGEYGHPEDCRESVPSLCPSERDLSASVLFRGCPVCGPTWELDRA